MSPFLFDLLLASLNVASFVREFAAFAIIIGVALAFYWWRMNNATT